MSFLSGHLRLSIPAALGDVVVFDRVTDPATRVPDIIAFMNDGDIDVTLHFDAGTNKAQATSTVDGSGGYTIVGQAFKVAIDGEAAITVTLTSGSRTRANVIGEINTALVAAGGNTALARAILVGTTHIAIVSGTSGQSSSVEIVTVASNAYSVLGFTVGVYTPANSFSNDIVSTVTIQPKGMSSFVNPRKNAMSLRIRAQTGNGTTGINSMIDATPLYSYSGVQQ